MRATSCNMFAPCRPSTKNLWCISGVQDSPSTGYFFWVSTFEKHRKLVWTIVLQSVCGSHTNTESSRNLTSLTCRSVNSQGTSGNFFFWANQLLKRLRVTGLIARITDRCLEMWKFGDSMGNIWGKRMISWVSQNHLGFYPAQYLEVSWNRATPSYHPCLDGIFSIKHLFWGYPQFRKPPNMVNGIHLNSSVDFMKSTRVMGTRQCLMGTMSQTGSVGEATARESTVRSSSEILSLETACHQWHSEKTHFNNHRTV